MPVKPRRPVIPLLPAEQQETAKELEKGGTGPIGTDVTPAAPRAGKTDGLTLEDMGLTPPPWLPEGGGPEIVDGGQHTVLDPHRPRKVHVIRAINLLWLMGFDYEAKLLREKLDKGEIKVDDIRVNFPPGQDNLARTTVAGDVYLTRELLVGYIEELARTLLHELYHVQHHTGVLGFAGAVLGGKTKREGPAEAQEDRFGDRQAELNRAGVYPHIVKQAVDMAREE